MSLVSAMARFGNPKDGKPSSSCRMLWRSTKSLWDAVANHRPCLEHEYHGNLYGSGLRGEFLTWIWEMLTVSFFFVLCSGWVSRHRHQIIMYSCGMRQISWDMIRRIIPSWLWPWDVWPPTYCGPVDVFFLNAKVSRRNCSAWTLFNAFHEAFLSLACHVSWVLPLLHHQEHTNTPLSKKPCKS